MADRPLPSADGWHPDPDVRGVERLVRDGAWTAHRRRPPDVSTPTDAVLRRLTGVDTSWPTADET